MKYDAVTHAIGKRIVGKQNILPLLRDCADDERNVYVTLDTERGRATGRICSVGTKDAHLLPTGRERGTRPTTLVAVIALRVDVVEEEEEEV